MEGEIQLLRNDRIYRYSPIFAIGFCKQISFPQRSNLRPLLETKAMATAVTIPKWQIDPSIDIDRVSLNDVKLIFAQAEKRLDDTVKTGEGIATKTMNLVTLVAGILIALSGFLISNWKGLATATNKDLIAVMGVLYVLTVFIYMIKNVLPNEYFVMGSEPSELMLPSFFDPAVRDDKITIFLYMNEIENYDYRIEVNLVVNNGRWLRFRRTVVALLMLPVLLGVVYILLEWLCPK